MKKLTLSLLGLFVLIIPLLVLGCETTTPTTTSAFVTAETYNAGVNALQTQINTKADASTVTALQNQVNNLPAQTASNSYSKTETYTQAEVNAKIAEAINALKVEKPWGTTGTSTGTSDTGQVIFTTNPVSIPQIFSSATGGNSSPWILHIENQSTTWQYVKPVLNLNVASGQPSSLVSDVNVMSSCGLCSLVGSFLTQVNWSFSPSTMATVATPSIVIIPISGCNGSGEIQLGPGQSQDINMQIQGLKTPNPILWNVSQSISSRPQ